MYDKALTKQAALIFPRFYAFKNFYLVGGAALASGKKCPGTYRKEFAGCTEKSICGKCIATTRNGTCES